MPISDHQLRQELLSFGESVPPITQANRDKLTARVEILRSSSRPSTRSTTNSFADRTSPSRATRTAAAPATVHSVPQHLPPPLRSRGLIELSDSEGEGLPGDHLLTRSTAAGTTTPSVQARSIQMLRRRPYDQSLAGSGETVGHIPTMSSSTLNEVEQSVARHRREIQQLIDSARDRSRAVTDNLSKMSGTASSSPVTTPIRVLPPSSILSRPPATRQPKPASKTKGPSWFSQFATGAKAFWKQNKNIIYNILKALLIGGVLGLALIFGHNRVPDLKELIPHRRGITCTAENATYCPDMEPLIRAVRTQLQTRTGEVDCGFRPTSELLVMKPEINKYLNDRGFKFENGEQDRWETLITYIRDKPVDDIIIYDKSGRETNDTKLAFKLSTFEAIRSLMCRTRKGVHSAVQNLAWLVGGVSSLLGLAWLIKRRSKKRQEEEDTYHDLLQRIINLLEDQYEVSQTDPTAKPYLAISHIHDILIPRKDREQLKKVWERAKKHISEQESRVRAESQLIHGEEFEVWRWIQPKSPTLSAAKNKASRPIDDSPRSSMSADNSYVHTGNEGLTQCLKLRHFFREDNYADDDEIDQVVESIQQRCMNVRRIEHIGIHATYVYLKLSSKEAAAQGYQLLNGWIYQGREIVAKYLRLERYHEHFPEAAASNISTMND